MKIITSFAIIALISVLAACGGAEDRKAAYLEKAEKSIKAGDLDKARIELKNVLQIDPKDSEAYFKLGVVYEGQQDFRKAYGNYSKASELDPENLKYHAKLGQYLLILASDIDKAKEKVKLIKSKDSDNIDGMMLEAAILLKEKKVAEAYGVWVEKSMYGRKFMGVERSTFLIDAKGAVRRIWRKVKVNGHADAVLGAAQELAG